MPNPTPEQLAARLNPTPSTNYIPEGGTFWDGYSTLYKPSSNGGLTALDISTLAPSTGTYANQGERLSAGRSVLQNQYGINVSSLPKGYNNDYMQKAIDAGAVAKIPGGDLNAYLNFYQRNGSVNDFVHAAPATEVANQINTQPNSIAPSATQQPSSIPGQQTPAQMAATFAATGQQPAAQPTPTTYTGPSIVDYLNSVGQASDYASRATLAGQYGIKNYTGSAAQNTQLLNTLRTTTPPTSQPTVTTPTGKIGESGTMGSAANNNSPGQVNAPDPYAGLDPIAKQVKMYTDAYKALGLSTIKDQFDSYTKQLGDIQNELNDKKQANQNNPWLSQGIVDRSNSQLDTKYATKIDTFTRLITLTDSLYKQGQAQVDHLVSDANADIKATNDLAQKTIDAANALAKDTQIVSIGGNQWLVNKQTGTKIANLGPVTVSTSLADKEALYLFQQQNKTTPLDSLFGNSNTPTVSQYAPSLYDQASSQIDWASLGL